MKSLILILAFFSASVFAQDKDWLTASSSKELLYEIKISSLSINKQNNPQAIIRLKRKEKSQFIFNLVSITKLDCHNGYGNLFFYDTAQNLQFTIEYVKDGGTHASNIADLLCIYDNAKTSV